jgi:hypothetical protein
MQGSQEFQWSCVENYSKERIRARMEVCVAIRAERCKAGRCESGMRLAGLSPLNGLRCLRRRQRVRCFSRGEVCTDHKAALLSLARMNDPWVIFSTPYRKVKRILQGRLRLPNQKTPKLCRQGVRSIGERINWCIWLSIMFRATEVDYA